ncbi:hypothetical protein Tco_1332688, partial [Tanacetum coccineum]
VVYVLTTHILDYGNDAIVDQLMKRAKWDHDDYVCRGLILNEAKYMVDDASSKKFLVSCIIDTLPPSWKDFKYTLKHLKKELTFIELGSHLRIKKSFRMQDSDKPKGNNVVGPLVVNMVEHNNSSRKPGHLKRDCKGGKTVNKVNGSGINGSVDGSTNSLKGQNIFNKSFQVYYVTYVSEAYFVQDDDVACMLDWAMSVGIKRLLEVTTAQYNVSTVSDLIEIYAKYTAGTKVNAAGLQLLEELLLSEG